MSTNGSPTLDEEMAAEDEKGRLYDITRRVLLASIGAVALAQDEIEKFIERLVERGEIAEKDGRNLIAEFREKNIEFIRKRRKRVRSSLGIKSREQEIEEVLERMNIPTKEDINALSKRIAALTRKVEELKKD